MRVGDIVVCNCEFDTWYKGIPGIIVEMGMWTTWVLISGKLIDISRSSLEVV
tara:strand:- start:1611 stop:1766 length:156 start_codon:yes stop_codon:yes gene_type:complete